MRKLHGWGLQEGVPFGPAGQPVITHIEPVAASEMVSLTPVEEQNLVTDHTDAYRQSKIVATPIYDVDPDVSNNNSVPLLPS
jgi:hypothetical protein